MIWVVNVRVEGWERAAVKEERGQGDWKHSASIDASVDARV